MTGSPLDLQASLDLQGGTLSAGHNGVPALLMLAGNDSGNIHDGTLLVKAGQTVDVLNREDLQGAVINDGTLNLTLGDYSVYGYFGDAVTGTGTIDVATDASIFHYVFFNAAVSAGQTIDFVGSGISVNIGFGNATACTSFAGTLNGSRWETVSPSGRDGEFGRLQGVVHCGDAQHRHDYFFCHLIGADRPTRGV